MYVAGGGEGQLSDFGVPSPLSKNRSRQLSCVMSLSVGQHAYAVGLTFQIIDKQVKTTHSDIDLSLILIVPAAAEIEQYCSILFR